MSTAIPEAGLAAPLLPTIGVPELLIILVIVLIFFGVGKLPEIGKALGQGIKNFRSAQGDLDKDAEKDSKPDEIEVSARNLDESDEKLDRQERVESSRDRS